MREKFWNPDFIAMRRTGAASARKIKFLVFYSRRITFNALLRGIMYIFSVTAKKARAREREREREREGKGFSTP